MKVKEGRGVGGGTWGDYIVLHLTRVAGETKGNVQVLRLWDTLPNCLGGQNQCHLFSFFTSYRIFYACKQEQQLLEVQIPLVLWPNVY